MQAKNKRPLGFISEHTAEFILVPKLVRLLEQHFSNITPIYYWASREGGNVNKAAFDKENVKVLVLFPRRPKITNDEPGSIYVKFNKILFDRCRTFERHGIPVIAGLPLASRIEDLHMQIECMWFHLLPNGKEKTEMIQLNNPLDIEITGVRSISETAIIDMLKGQASLIKWQKFLEIIKQTKREELPSWFGFGGTYKPIYFLIRD